MDKELYPHKTEDVIAHPCLSMAIKAKALKGMDE